MKKFGRLSKTEIQRRVLELETVFGQKKLSKVLGVSPDTIRRYRDGKTTPQSKKIYDTINKKYNKSKSFIESDLVETKKQQINKRKTAYKVGKTKERFTTIYPTYMYGPAARFEGIQNFEKLEDLHDAGYVAGWLGGKAIPLEVQFVIRGNDLSDFADVIHMVGVTSTEVSPKEDNQYTGITAMLRIIPISRLLIRGLNATLSYTDKMDKLREYFHEHLNTAVGLPLAFLGWYVPE